MTTTIKYHFADIENGQIAEGYTAIDISAHEAEVDAADTEVMLLAEKYGGELAGALPPPSMAPKEGAAINKKRTAIEVKPGETAELTDEGGTS